VLSDSRGSFREAKRPRGLRSLYLERFVLSYN
jgi:hypothetical protein